MTLADGIVIGILAVLVVLILVFLRKSKKKGRHCSGFSGCSSHTGCPEKKE